MPDNSFHRSSPTRVSWAYVLADRGSKSHCFLPRIPSQRDLASHAVLWSPLCSILFTGAPVRSQMQGFCGHRRRAAGSSQTASSRDPATDQCMNYSMFSDHGVPRRITGLGAAARPIPGTSVPSPCYTPAATWTPTPLPWDRDHYHEGWGIQVIHHEDSWRSSRLKLLPWSTYPHGPISVVSGDLLRARITLTALGSLDPDCGVHHDAH